MGFRTFTVREERRGLFAGLKYPRRTNNKGIIIGFTFRLTKTLQVKAHVMESHFLPWNYTKNFLFRFALA